MKQKKRRLLSMVLSVAMLFSMTGVNTVLAAKESPPGEYGRLCEHHTRHTKDCYTNELICGFTADGDEDIATDSNAAANTATGSNAAHRHTQECYRCICQCDICNPPSMRKAALADGDVLISEENFPDENFRNWLLYSDGIGGMGANETLTAAEINSITSINIADEGIADLTGIEFFRNLTELDCSYNLLSGSLDLSNIQINYLYCQNNDLTEIVLNNAATYNSIDVSGNQLAGESAVTGKDILWDRSDFRFAPQQGDTSGLDENGLLSILDVTPMTGDGWDWNGLTLTLKDINGTAPDPVRAVEFNGSAYDATIVLESDVTLDATGIGGIPAINYMTDDGRLTIDAGTHTLTLIVKPSTDSNRIPSISSSSALDITGGSVTTEGDIRTVAGNLDISGGSVTAAGLDVNAATISGSANVTVTVNGIYSNWDLIISEDSSVTVTGGSEGVALGSFMGDVIIDNSMVTVKNTGGGPAILATFATDATAPALTSAHVAKASINADGSGPVELYDENAIATYKYMEIVADNPLTTVTSVTVSPAAATVQKGMTQQFTAVVAGRHDPAQTVTWAVSGQAKADTSITAAGLLTVAADETAGSLTVTATSTVDTGKTGTATVTVQSEPVTSYQLTVTNGTGTGGYQAGASITVTADAPQTGKRFKEWTATGLTGVSLTANPFTFQMPAAAVTLTAVYEDIPAVMHTVTAAAGTGGSITPSGAVTVSDGGSQSFTVAADSGYSIADVKVDGVSKGSLANYTFDSITEDHAISAEFSYNGGGGGNGGNGGGNGGDNTTTTTQPPSKQDPAQNTTVQTNVDATTDNNGTATATVPEKNVTDVIKAAQDAAKKAGAGENSIGVVIDVKTNKAASTISTTLPAGAVNELIKEGIPTVKIQSSTVDITLDLAALKAAQAAAGGTVTATAVKQNAGGLSAAAQAAIGSRPAFDFTLQSGGKSVTELGDGTAILSIPYTPQAGEDIGRLCIVYVDGNGGVTWMAASGYDPNTKSMLVKTGRFALYGVGYRNDAPRFTDIANHWAKDDIDFVTARGLLGGTGAATFSPDAAMARGVFVTALGRLAGINPDSYRTGRFADVAADTYYAPYVNWAAEKGILDGTGDTTFAPEQAVARQELAVIMANYARACGYTVPKTREAMIFADNGSIAEWAKASVKSMQIAGVMNGKDAGRFDPTGIATRAETAAVLHRYVELTIDPATAQGWDRNDSGQWLYYENGRLAIGWKLVDGKWYYFDTAGIMQSNGWKQIDGKWYYLYADGSMAAGTTVDGYEVGPDGARK